MRGVLHLHTIFSDGEEPLERIVETFRDAGMSFVAVSDHAEVFDDARMQQYVGLCESLSSTDFLVIPGLEFALKGGGIHILGYGTRKRVRAATMEGLVDGIHEAGGLAVLAHPPEGSINMIGAIKDKLDGIEVWNGRYDGTVAPRMESFQLLRRVQLSNERCVAFAGVDLHQIAQAQKPICIEIEAVRLKQSEIMAALGAGSFTIRRRSVTVPSSGNLTMLQQLSIAVKQPLCWARRNMRNEN